MSVDFSSKKKKKLKTPRDLTAVVESTEWIHLNVTECFVVHYKQWELQEIKELDFSVATRYT